MRASKFNEIEYKYRADKVGLLDFIEFIKREFKGKSAVESSGTDYFFSKAEGEFLRYRKGNDVEELTLKRKIERDNNWNRVEVDIPLSIGDVELDAVKKMAEMLGLSYRFNITKNTYVIRTPSLIFSYYYVNGKDCYIEIEAEKVDQDTGKVFMALDAAEEKLKSLGIDKRNRSTKSLYEIYGGK